MSLVLLLHLVANAIFNLNFPALVSWGEYRSITASYP